MTHRVAALFIFATAATISLAAPIYTWTDANGVMNFSDTPPTSKQDAQTILIQPTQAAFKPEGQITGSARVIDGDTLDIAGTRIRLHGIDAVEKRQYCSGTFNQQWPCGQEAESALIARIGPSVVHCDPRDHDHYGRTVAVCYVGAEDLNAWMVSQGWAVAYTRYSADYVKQEKEARGLRRNIWRGSFIPPESYRHPENMLSGR